MSYISIIIPAYNEENKIKDTLESIKDKRNRRNHSSR